MTTPALTPTTDLDQLAEEMQPPCDVTEYNHPGNPIPAAWVVRWQPCGCAIPTPPALLCDPCVEELRATARMRCNSCGWEYLPGWSIVLSAEPIRSAP